MPYAYRVRRPIKLTPVVVEEPSYRDLQAKAGELGIPANQSAAKLKAAIKKAGGE